MCASARDFLIIMTLPPIPWSMINQTRRAKIVFKIRKLILKYGNLTNMNKLLSAVFSSQFNHGMHSRSNDYHAKSAIVENIVNELDNLKRKEHQSGAFRALVSACAGSNITQAELARQLKIHRNAVRAVIFFSNESIFIQF